MRGEGRKVLVNLREHQMNRNGSKSNQGTKLATLQQHPLITQAIRRHGQYLNTRGPTWADPGSNGSSLQFSTTHVGDFCLSVCLSALSQQQEDVTVPGTGVTQ